MHLTRGVLAFLGYNVAKTRVLFEFSKKNEVEKKKFSEEIVSYV